MFLPSSPSPARSDGPLITGPTPVTPTGPDLNLGTDSSGVPRAFKPEPALSATCVVTSDVTDEENSQSDSSGEESAAPDEAEVQAARELLDLEVAAPPQGFVVAITTTKLRRLHYVGNCGRRPGEHYRSFEAFGSSPPARRLYDSRCRQCFPEGEFELESGSSDSSASSTHSSE